MVCLNLPDLPDRRKVETDGRLVSEGYERADSLVV